MASYKSQFSPPRRVDEQTPYAHRAPSTRLPQRSVTPTSTNASQLPGPVSSRLQKRKPARDEQSQPSRGITTQRVPLSTSIAPKTRQGSNTPSVPMSHSSTHIAPSKTLRQISSSRLPKLEVVGSTRTPSLVSGSSASTIDSPRSNLLRRNPSNIGGVGRQNSRTRGESMESQDERQPMKAIPGGYKDPFSETVLGISLPPSSNILARAEAEVEIPDARYYEYDLAPTEILPLPTPHYALSTTPSTRYSESPGPFSVSSTPTSMSSYSPGVALSKSSVRNRQASPLESRPPVVRNRSQEETNIRQQHALSSVRESSTSSSSASTILAEGARQREKRSPARLTAPPPSPPPKSFAQRAAQSTRQTDSSRSDVLNGHRSPPPVERKPRIQAPPELAHLADHPPTTSPEPRRPTRPSRDGTVEIAGLRGPSPIIQSNMTSFPSSHKRTSSSESKSGIAISSRTRFGLTSKPSSRNPSPNPSLPSTFPPASRVPTRGPTPEIQADADKKRAKTLPIPTPSPSKTSRFGFFSRRAKTEPDPKAEKKLLHRRGPVAGTGHEGYGKYSLRGRSGSTASAGSIGRSASAGTTTESLGRTPSTRKSSMSSTTSTEMDDFFLERLRPVVIRGTGSSTELSRSPEPMHSESSLDLPSSSLPESKKTDSNAARSGLEQNRPALLPSAMNGPVRTMSPMKKTIGSRRPSDSDSDAKKSFLPSLATRRASRASKMLEGAPLSKVSSASSTASKSRNGSVPNDYLTEGREGKWLKSKKTEKVEKGEKAPKAPRKWNFFQRAHATPRIESPRPTPVVEVATSATRTPASRSVAHYALMDSQSAMDLQDLEQLMQEADSAPEELTPADDEDRAIAAQDSAQRERLQSMLLPPLPVLPPNFAPPARPASPKVFLRPEMQWPAASQLRKLTVDTTVNDSQGSNPQAPPSLADLTPVTDLSPSSSPFRSRSPISPAEPAEPVEPVESASASDPQDDSQPTPEFTLQPQTLAPPTPLPSIPPPRPSRLLQIGRIPQVVSSRQTQERRPPSASFSRPFVSDQPRPNVPPRTSFDSVASMLATAGPVESYPILQGLDALSHASAIATISPSADESNRQSEFFKFPPRKDSELSYSSSSGIWSFPPTTGTAVVPSPNAPQSEDEVWKEYDDLIDEVLSPSEAQKDAVSCQTTKQNSEVERRPSLEPLPLKSKASRTSTQSGASNPSLHLRRSRLLQVLHEAQTPTSPCSLSEFLQGYGERNLSVIDPVTGRLSFPSTTRNSTGSGPGHRPRSSLPTSLKTVSARQSKATLASNSDRDRDSAPANRYRDTRLMEIAESQTDGLVSMANLRFGALMTSKWLSFGRVLFSPVHFELKDPNEDRVLVIDGLGKDWSYYCALTYPEATIYNLGHGPSSSAPANGQSEPWSTLRNHRHIGHPSLDSPFPFPSGFFACAVLRFPPALPSSVHRAVLSECKRVLRPGGFLEMSVLDLDLVNMGNRARRAVRGLKVKMQVADEQISLRNISDEMMAILGRRGFTECNRCFVGVPVAGRLPSADESDISEGKKRKGSSASTMSAPKGTPAPTPTKPPKPEVSFSDLLSARSSSDSSVDDGITEMVARVGRWWYSRCYETLVLPEAGEPGAAESGNLLDSSIWKDESLIKECEKRGTSFRLLIGYAQKPEVGVRRTVSV